MSIGVHCRSVFYLIERRKALSSVIIFAIASCAALPAMLACGMVSASEQATPTQQSASWTLAWSDEFDGSAGSFPNANNWAYDLGNGGFGNPEIEYYCAPGSAVAPCAANRPNAAMDGKGNLVLQALRMPDGRWTSARLKSQGLEEPLYGRIEARMKLPVGNGFWPAFWMLGANIDSTPWPGCGEQDIMEWVQSYGPTVTSSTTHGPGYSAAHGIGTQAALPQGGRIDDDGFHIYGVIWKQDSIQYYRDDPAQIIATLTPATIPAGSQWVFNKPFFLLLNLAIGNGGFPGSTDATTPAVATMLIDYVRVYRAS